jgi:UDP-glucuronate 4-epimerase
MNNASEGADNAPHRTIIVTGAAGFFGSHIAARFLRAGRHVVVFDKLNAETTSADEKETNLRRLHAIAADTPGARLSVYRGDILDPGSIREALDATNPTACVHTASLVDDRRSVYHPKEYLTVNILGTQTLLQTISDHGSVRQFVYVSTRSTFGQVDNAGQLMTEEAPKRPINPYGASKVGAEAICHVYHHLSGIDLNIIRIFALYGPYGRPDMIPRQLMEKVGSGEEIQKFGSGEANRDWMYVEDAAEAVFLATHKPLGYQIFNIGTGRGTTLNELIATAESVIGKPANIRHLPVPPGDAHFVGIADNTKARAILGWAPQTTLKQGMTKTLAQMTADALIEA